jgi:ABC-type dipeptide/oligopeptide/nickel transport system permease component
MAWQMVVATMVVAFKLLADLAYDMADPRSR